MINILRNPTLSEKQKKRKFKKLNKEHKKSLKKSQQQFNKPESRFKRLSRSASETKVGKATLKTKRALGKGALKVKKSASSASKAVSKSIKKSKDYISKAREKSRARMKSVGKAFSKLKGPKKPKKTIEQKKEDALKRQKTFIYNLMKIGFIVLFIGGIAFWPWAIIIYFTFTRLIAGYKYMAEPY